MIYTYNKKGFSEHPGKAEIEIRGAVELANRELPEDSEDRLSVYVGDSFPPKDKKFVNGELIAKTEDELIAEGFYPASDVAKKLVDRINSEAGAKIAGGFESSARGEAHIYDTDLEDQFNFKVMLDSDSDVIDYRCTNKATGSKTFYRHTPAQFKQVYNEFLAYKLAILKKADRMKNEVQTYLENEEDDRIFSYQISWT